MTDVHQVLVGAGTADAITTEAIALREELRRNGRSEIFALHRDPDVPGVFPLDAYPGVRASSPATLLFHVSIGEPAMAQFLAGNSDPMILRYHNITPSEFFEPYDPGFAGLLRRGRDELAGLRHRSRRAIAVSEFNAAELRGLGFPDVTVSPLLMDLDGLLATAPAPSDHYPLPAPGEGAMILFVGRLAPNKNQHLLMQAFHVLKTYLDHDAHLFLVGGRPTLGYQGALDRYARELALPQAAYTDMVSQAELSAIYRRADVFVTLSAHEGFCAPLVEAMAFGVPVVAWGSSAIPETARGAALLLDEPGPELVAEAVHAVLASADLRSALAQRGRARATELRVELTAPRLAGQVLEVAS